jgi:3-oxoadipate enol-lactonase
MTALAYDLDERIDGSPDAPLLVLGSSLGTTARMWEPQVEALSRHFRVLRYDHRGHGRSPVPAGDYDLDDLGGDVLEMLDRVGAERVSYAGISLGGMVGMWLATHAPERIDRLVLVCTSAYLPPLSVWTDRAAAVRSGGMDSIADAVLGRWFTAAFRDRAPAAVTETREWLRSAPPEGYAGCCAAIGGMDLRPDLAGIAAPTLVLSATHDEAIPALHGQQIAQAVPGARFELVPGAHLASIESAELVTGLMLDHLGEIA